jgi:hypothetical protein
VSEEKPEGDVRIPRRSPPRLRHARIHPGQYGDWGIACWFASQHEAARVADWLNEKLGRPDSKPEAGEP